MPCPSDAFQLATIANRVRSGFARRSHTLLATALAFAGGSLACEPLATEWNPTEREPVVVHEAARIVRPTNANPDELRVMTWNTKYGAGRIDFWFDLWGDRVQMSEAEVQTNLRGIYDLIEEVDPDILMTQEIEINSRRSAYVNMVKGILDNTSMNYAAYYPTWRARYVPSEGLGRIDMGNAIFSKYPIRSAERIPQEDRTDQDPATSYFYLHRAVGRAVIDVGARNVVAMVVHTEAYDQDGTKGRQLVQIAELMNEENGSFVVGGDFNALPPVAVKTKGFPDESPEALGTDFEQPPYDTDEMQPFFDDFVPAIELERYGTTQAQQRRYFTHSVIGRDRTGTDGMPGFWSRTLDYLFVASRDSWVPDSGDVLQAPGHGSPPIESDPMDLSDHAPVVGTWELGP